MKLTAILILGTCLSVAARTDGQTITISAQNRPIKDILTAIEAQSGYCFIYEKELIRTALPVSISVKNEPLSKVLELIFLQQPLAYKVSEKYIVLSKKTGVFQPPVSPSDPLPPPPIDVRGRIVNEAGEPVAGASVQVKGDKTKGTSTDANGYFELKGVDENATLIISGVNIEEREINVEGQNNLGAVRVKNKISEGEEVQIVSTGYQDIPKERATGSFVLLKDKQLDERVATDIISKLEGIASGLVFNKDANTGANKLRIRGESTIYGYSNPLIIVDGFPYDSDLSTLNPNDVESVTILKDAAASSIWGVQAGNGVVVIVTKNGKYNQKQKISVVSNVSIIEKPNLYYKPQIGTGDYIDFQKNLFEKGYYDAQLIDQTMPVVSPIVEILARQKSGAISSTEATNLINNYRELDIRNDLTKHFYKVSTRQQYLFNLSGGATNTSYYLSSGYDKNAESIQGNLFNRVTLNGNLFFRPAKKIELRFNLAYAESNDRNNGTDFIPHIYPFSRLKDENGNQFPIPQRRAIFEDTIINRGFLDWKYYPLQEPEFRSFNRHNYNTRVVAGFTYDIVKGLNFDLLYQYNRSITRGKSITSEDSYFIRDKINSFAIVNNGNFAGTNYPRGGRMALSVDDLISHNGRFKLNYSRNWDGNHFSGIIGVDVRETRLERNSSVFYGYDERTGTFINPDFMANYPVFPNGGTTTIGSPGLSFEGSINRFRSYFTNIAYAYKNRYIVSASCRFDGSNYFGVETNKKTVPLWSTGIKWDVGKESFFSLRSILDLSLRVTYGFQGNLAPNLAALATIDYRGNEVNTGLPYAYINNIPNPELRWERVGQFNTGFDFSLVGKGVSGSIEYFRKMGKDLIGDSPLDYTTGIIQQRGNFAQLVTRGIDVQLTFQNKKSRAIQWLSRIIFNYSADKLIKYDISQTATQYLASYKDIIPIVGKPLYSFYSYRWGGLDPVTGGPMIILGDTLNKSYTINTETAVKLNDLSYSGRYNPPITGAILTALELKNFSLSFNVTYKFKYRFRRASIKYYNLDGNWQNIGHKDYALRWQNPGDEQFTNVPSFDYSMLSNTRRDLFYSNSDILLEKGDHIRLQYINIGYTVPDRFVKMLPFSGISIFLYANNLGILWRANNKGIDPDYPYSNYIPSRSWSFGLKAQF